MCLAKKYAEQINEIIHKANEDYEILRKQESELDKELSQKYHVIETTNFNASEGYCLAKSLQETLQKRRINKHEKIQMQKFVEGVTRKNIETGLNKIQQSINQKEESYMAYSENFSVNIGDVLKEKLQLN